MYLGHRLHMPLGRFSGTVPRSLEMFNGKGANGVALACISLLLQIGGEYFCGEKWRWAKAGKVCVSDIPICLHEISSEEGVIIVYSLFFAVVWVHFEACLEDVFKMFEFVVASVERRHCCQQCYGSLGSPRLCWVTLSRNSSWRCRGLFGWVWQAWWCCLHFGLTCNPCHHVMALESLRLIQHFQTLKLYSGWQCCLFPSVSSQ